MSGSTRTVKPVTEFKTNDSEPANDGRLVETHQYLTRFDRATARLRVVDIFEEPDGGRRYRVQDRPWPGL